MGTEDSCGAGGPTFVFLGLRWKLPQHALIDPFLLPFPVFLFLCLHSRPPWQALFFLRCWAARPRSVLGSPCVWGCVCCLFGCDASSARAQLHRAWFTLFSFLFKALNSFQSPPLSHADSSCALCCPALPFHWVSSQRMWGCQLVPVGWWWVRVGPPMAQGCRRWEPQTHTHRWFLRDCLPLGVKIRRSAVCWCSLGCYSFIVFLLFSHQSAFCHNWKLHSGNNLFSVLLFIYLFFFNINPFSTIKAK